MASEKTRMRRQYNAAIKAKVVAERAEPGVSVAQVAMSHGINANVVHRWRQLARQAEPPVPAKAVEFIWIPLAMPAATSVPADIRVLVIAVGMSVARHPVAFADIMGVRLNAGG